MQTINQDKFKKSDIINHVKSISDSLDKSANDIVKKILDNFSGDYMFSLRECKLIYDNLYDLGKIKELDEEQNKDLYITI